RLPCGRRAKRWWSSGRVRERGQWQGDGFGHGAADLDHRINGDGGSGPGKVRTEVREPVDQVLAGWKRHVAAPSQDADRVPARQTHPNCRIVPRAAVDEDRPCSLPCLWLLVTGVF